MKEPSGPDLHITLPKLRRCEPCKGYGIIKPLLHEMYCADCGGAGFVDDETGFALAPEIALVAMNRMVRRLRKHVTELRQSPSDECPIYGPLRTRNGGRARGD